MNELDRRDFLKMGIVVVVVRILCSISQQLLIRTVNSTSDRGAWIAMRGMWMDLTLVADKPISPTPQL